jgi:hypothetical protein
MPWATPLAAALQPDLTKRLGNLAGGVQDIKSHAWFTNIKWDKLARKELEAPYTPAVKVGGSALPAAGHTGWRFQGLQLRNSCVAWQLLGPAAGGCGSQLRCAALLQAADDADNFDDFSHTAALDHPYSLTPEQQREFSNF